MTHSQMENLCAKAWEDYNTLLEADKPTEAKQSARAVLKELVRVARGSAVGIDGSTRSAALVLAILFRGLLDLVDLTEMVAVLDWLKDTAKIEDAWGLLCDCRCRIECGLACVPGPVLAPLLEKLKEVEDAFSRQFGSGMYASPEIVCKGVICSVCGQDFRGCEHLAGNVYDGVLCGYSPSKDSYLKAVALVEHPADPRCRIWPWLMKDNKRIEGLVIMTTFRPDDFNTLDDL